MAFRHEPDEDDDWFSDERYLRSSPASSAPVEAPPVVESTTAPVALVEPTSVVESSLLPVSTPAPVTLVEPAPASTPVKAKRRSRKRTVEYDVQVSGNMQYKCRKDDYQFDKVTTTDKGQIIIQMPRIYAQMRTATISYWHHEEETAYRQRSQSFWDDEKKRAEYTAPTTIVKPGDFLFRAATKPADFDVTLPPWIDFPCRIVAVLRQAGERVRVGDKLIVLRRIESETAQQEQATS